MTTTQIAPPIVAKGHFFIEAVHTLFAVIPSLKTTITFVDASRKEYNFQARSSREESTNDVGLKRSCFSVQGVG